MKKLLILLSIIFVTFGCSQNNTQENLEKEEVVLENEDNINQETIQEAPEPYTKAIEAINNKNWKLANKYLELVITDFPNSEYIYPAQILRGLFHLSNSFSAIDLLNSFPEPSSLYDENDIATMKGYLDLIEQIFAESDEQLVGIFTYLVENYQSDINYPDYFMEIKSIEPYNGYFYDLTFFKNVGYPVPNESEIQEFLNAKKEINIRYGLNDFTKKEDNLNYSLLFLFYNASLVLRENHQDLSIKLDNLILEITEDDPYNEYRISIEK